MSSTAVAEAAGGSVGRTEAVRVDTNTKRAEEMRRRRKAARCSLLTKRGN